MATKKKLLQAAAGNAGGAGLNVEEVFSTYLYTGNGSTQTITNGIDLAGEGGLVWTKTRSNDEDHKLFDSGQTAVTYALSSNNADASSNRVSSLTSFNSNGFSLGSQGEVNELNYTFASWTFRKAPKFFDVVTYTGNGVAGRTVSHSLNSVPGCIIVKATNNARSWAVYHRGTDSTAPEDYGLYLNETTDRSDDAQLWNDTAPTSTEFTVGTDGDTNVSGRTYVAYLFAHNDGDGEFGPDGDADIIKCGSYTGNGSTTGPEIDLGFEPQWLLIKRTSGSEEWLLFDVMRGIPTGGYDPDLRPAQSNAENTDRNWLDLTSTGFQPKQTSNHINGNGENYIYIAIRRGTKVPESGTEVFDIDVSIASQPYSVTTSLNYVDATINRVLTSGQAFLHNRLTGSNWMFTDSTNAESNSPNDVKYDFNGKVMPYFYISGDSHVNYMWKRAPSYMDVVAYTGNGTAGRTVSHNLGVAPEMMWVKDRDDAEDWSVYHAGITNPEQNYLYLNSTSALNPNSNTIRYWNHTAPTDSVFTLGDEGRVNQSGENYIAYLFASLAGISKVGSASHSGTTNVDCGFSSGARFVLLKRTDATGDWYVWDSERGIVSGNDPYLLLNTNAAQVTNTDYIDPLSSGFTITSSFTAGDYIFYAIA